MTFSGTIPRRRSIFNKWDYGPHGRKFWKRSQIRKLRKFNNVDSTVEKEEKNENSPEIE